MAESEAEQNYKVFTSLRDKFGGPGTQKSIPDDSHHHQVQKRLERPHSAGKRRPGYEPRTNAPPLMPLVEEGDQIQQELYLVEERLTKLTVTVSWKAQYNCISVTISVDSTSLFNMSRLRKLAS